MQVCEHKTERGKNRYTGLKSVKYKPYILKAKFCCKSGLYELFKRNLKVESL